jgi:hypothetical protein
MNNNFKIKSNLIEDEKEIITNVGLKFHNL